MVPLSDCPGGLTEGPATSTLTAVPHSLVCLEDFPIISLCLQHCSLVLLVAASFSASGFQFSSQDLMENFLIPVSKGDTSVSAVTLSLSITFISFSHSLIFIFIHILTVCICHEM